jgi:hypothetical protein
MSKQHNTARELFDIAHIEGVGCTYLISSDGDTFTVHVTSGPVSKLEREQMTFRGAMRYVENEIADQLVDEGAPADYIGRKEHTR